MKKINTYAKNTLSSTIIALMVLTPAFAFAKDEGVDRENNPASQFVRQDSSDRLKDNDFRTSRTSRNENIRDNQNDNDKNDETSIEINDKNKDNNEKKDNTFNKHGKLNLGQCIKTLRNLTISDILKLNMDNGATLSQICLGTAATTTDIVAPVISNIVIVPGVNKATVTWTTNELSDSAVFFSTTTPVNTSSTTMVKNAKKEDKLVLNHKIKLDDLQATTTFNIIIRSRDASGNTSLSSIQSFTTLAEETSEDVAAPVINSIVTSASTSTIKVTVTTNEASKVKVFFSTTTPVNTSSSSTSFVESVGFLTTTTVTISNLATSTLMNLVVQVKDQAGNTKLSGNFTATTVALPIADTTPPVISNVVALAASSSISLAWLTNEIATTKAFFSTTTPVDVTATSTSFIENLSLVTNHVLTIPGLVANTIFNLILQSKDAVGNIINSMEFHVATTPAV